MYKDRHTIENMYKDRHAIEVGEIYCKYYCIIIHHISQLVYSYIVLYQR